jgi:phenylalanyl-tRNA synthetase beta chain
MKVTRNWLAEFVDIDMPLAQLAERLAMAGFEVESITQHGRELSAVKCAEIVRVTPHPRAERLSICDVRAGTEGVVRVICGAPNVRAGERVPYAPPGTTLPGGDAITVAEIHGVASAGMLCSEAELGLGSEASGLLILPRNAPVGAALSGILGLEDAVLDISVSPNRGDCLSVLGMAREIAALTGRRLRRQPLRVRESADPVAALVDIRIDDADLCGRYTGRVVTGVSIGPAPLAIRYRLRAVGLRPINNVVDVTNYVMVERGQPLHAFDYDRLPAHEITVRRAGTTTTFTTLDTQRRDLHPDDLLITSGGRAVAIAGVMGGADSEVTDATRRILLESAWFAPASVRRTARRLGLRTEASFRFERCTDIEGVPLAADRAAALIVELAGGSIAAGRVDVYPAARPSAPIVLRLKRVEHTLGMSLNRADVVAKLKALGVAVSPGVRGTLAAAPPSYRADLTREIDLIEEVVRLIGYENVPTTFPAGEPMVLSEASDYRPLRDIKRFVAAQGLHESIFLSFCSARQNALFPGLVLARRAVAVLNPMTQDDSELRLSLCSGLVRIVRDNLAQGVDNVALFSVGKVFWREAGFHEARRISGAVCPGFPRRGLGRSQAAGFTDVKGVVEGLMEFLGVGEGRWLEAAGVPAFHPGRTAQLVLDGATLGIVGALHPAVEAELELRGPCWLFELDLDRLLQYCPRRVIVSELPRFPAVVRDLAVVAEERFVSDELVRFVREWSTTSQLIEDIQLFDQYVGPPIPAGKKSLAYSISYRAADRTLTDAEVSAMHAQLIAALKDALHVEPR